MSVTIMKPIYCRRPFDAEEFLQMVRKFPFLYDKSEASFKDTRLKEQHWNKIGAIYGMKGEACCSKFKNMKDRYTKLATAIEKAIAAGHPPRGIKCIRWKLFPIIHDLLSSTPFSKNLPIDIRTLFERRASAYSPMQDNEDSSYRDDDLVKRESNEEEEEIEVEEEEDYHPRSKQMLINNDSTFMYHNEHEEDSQPHFVISGTNSCDEKTFNNGGETSASSTTKTEESPAQSCKRMREEAASSTDNNLGQALNWATQIVEAIENKRQFQQKTKNDPEEDEITHFTSYLKHRLLQIDRKKRLKIVHDIENLLYEAEVGPL